MQLQLQRTQSHRRRTIEIPHTMEAAAIDHFGPPEVLTLHVLPVPAVDAGEVLIALDTAGVGPWDADIREGWYPSGTPHFPLVLGVDGAGIVPILRSMASMMTSKKRHDVSRLMGSMRSLR